MLGLLLCRMYPNFILLVFRQLHVYCTQSLTFISFHYHSWHHFSRMIECVQYSFERNERIAINNNDSDIPLLIHYHIEWYHDLYVILFITHKIKNVKNITRNTWTVCLFLWSEHLVKMYTWYKNNFKTL